MASPKGRKHSDNAAIRQRQHENSFCPPPAQWSPRPIEEYRDGGEGFIRWCEDYVCIPIYPEGSDIPRWTSMGCLPTEPNPHTGRSYQEFWDKQKVIVREALEMENGRFKKRLIIVIWPRGEGKSFLAVLIQLWKFFCWPRQQIVLGANSKEQTKFVHYDIMKDIILHSPRLVRLVGKKNVQEKEIRIKDKDGNTVSVIRSISSFSGIVSNITGYTFSEMFDMKNPKFFQQIDGSIRNIPNALGVIDSTVSDKSHILYKLYETYRDDKDPYLFVSYRYAQHGKQEEYWHPQNTQAQLDSYRNKFTASAFAMYFLNLWESGSRRMFTPPQLEAMQYIGIEGAYGRGTDIIHELETKHKYMAYQAALSDTFTEGSSFSPASKAIIDRIQEKLIPIERHISLTDLMSYPAPVPAVKLAVLGDMLNTNWAIAVGIDRADPTRQEGTGGADTIISVFAKGLANSRSFPFDTQENKVPAYLYVQIHFCKIETSLLADIKFELLRIKNEYGAIHSLSSEKWGMFDIVPWCEDNSIPFEPVSTAYEKQKEVFTELHGCISTGRLKAGKTGVPGRRMVDLKIEQYTLFDHDVIKKWFGSPEKTLRMGVQDDGVYADAYAIYGARYLDSSSFIDVGSTVQYWGEMFANHELAL